MTDEEFDERIDAIFRKRDERSDHHLKMLRESDDLTSVILKGHLIAEELISAGIEAYCRDKKQFRDARLRFSQRVSLLRALERIPSAPPSFWNAVLHLNRLRNELAHNLDQEHVPALSAKFVRALESYSRDKRFPRPLEGRDALIQALHFLLGGLEVVSVWQEGVEVFVRQQLYSKS